VRSVLGPLALCLLVAAIGAVAAQDGGVVTPNLKSPNAIADNDFRFSIDWRYWNGGNDTFTALGEYGITDRLSVGVNYVTFDNLGKPPIAGALRASSLEGPGGWLKYVGREAEGNTFGWAVVPGVEYLDLNGTNTALGTSAGGKETVFTLEVPIGIPDGDALWTIDPKLAVFPDTEPVTGPDRVAQLAEVDSFGTVLGLGLGVVAPLGPGGNWWVYGDVTPILSGDNSIGKATNALTIQLPWTFGVRRQVDLGEECYVDLFATNASGGTTATSLIAAPDRSVGFGARASILW
jgi:hypothetical protein